LIRKQPGSGKWNGIGGHIESDEDIFSSVLREIKEETGLTIKKIWLSAIITQKEPRNGDVILFVFNALRPAGNLQQSEEGEISWIDQHELEKLSVFDDLQVLLKITEKIDSHTQPLILHYQRKQGNKKILLRDGNSFKKQQKSTTIFSTIEQN